MKTRKIIEVPEQLEIAKINRKTGDIFVSSGIWDRLPPEEKEFVLLHEDGHLLLQTTDEYQANAYAIDKFVPEDVLTNQQLGQRILIMRSILDKADDNFSPFAADSISQTVGVIFQNLPLLGIGSKARVKESAANIELLNAQGKISSEKSKATTKAIIIGGTMLLVLAVIILTLKK